MNKRTKVDDTVFEGTFYKVSERPIPFRVETIDWLSLTTSINPSTSVSMLVDDQFPGSCEETGKKTTFTASICSGTSWSKLGDVFFYSDRQGIPHLLLACQSKDPRDFRLTDARIFRDSYFEDIIKIKDINPRWTKFFDEKAQVYNEADFKPSGFTADYLAAGQGIHYITTFLHPKPSSLNPEILAQGHYVCHVKFTESLDPETLGKAPLQGFLCLREDDDGKPSIVTAFEKMEMRNTWAVSFST